MARLAFKGKKTYCHWSLSVCFLSLSTPSPSFSPADLRLLGLCLHVGCRCSVPSRGQTRVKASQGALFHLVYGSGTVQFPAFPKSSTIMKKKHLEPIQDREAVTTLQWRTPVKENCQNCFGVCQKDAMSVFEACVYVCVHARFEEFK